MKEKVKATKRTKSYKTKWKFVLAMMPNLLLLTLFDVYPNISVFPLSLYEWGPITTQKIYVGMKNFKLMFSVRMKETMELAGNTLIYVFGLFLIQTLLALALALALQKNTRKNKFFRAYFFLPMVFSSTMVGLTWAFMYDANLGIINNILGMLGVDGYPGKVLLGEEWYAVLLIAIVHIWANIGYPITILLSGLNTISGDLGEAAMIDGANTWQTFCKITFPLLLPTIFRLSLLTLTTGALAADYIVTVGGRGTDMPYDTWASYIYKETLSSTDYGAVSAAAVLMFFFLLIVNFVQFLAMRKVENKVLG